MSPVEMGRPPQQEQAWFRGARRQRAASALLAVLAAAWLLVLLWCCPCLSLAESRSQVARLGNQVEQACLWQEPRAAPAAWAAGLLSC